jgi:hypothetical protein
MNVQMTVINNARKIVHIREIFWNSIGPVSQILRCIFQCASATENKESDANTQSITITSGTHVMKCDLIQIQPVIIFQ